MKKIFIKGFRLIKVFDDNINVRERIGLVRDVKASHENLVDYIPLFFMNELLCMKYFYFHALMTRENNIKEVNIKPIIIKKK